MTRISRAKWLCAVFAGVIGLPAAKAQAPRSAQRLQQVPPSVVTVDGSEPMFATMCALLASGFEANVSADNWSVFRAQMRERLQQQKGPAVDALREFYQRHLLSDPGATLSQYVWFGLVSGPAPKFQPILRRDELPPEVLALEGFSEVLANYYQEQKIGELWKQVQSIYNNEIVRLHDPISQIVFVTDGYLRQMLEPSNQRTFSIIVEPLVGRITNLRNFGDHYTIVLSGSTQIPIDVVRHAYLHFLLDPLPLRYSHVVAVKRPLFDKAALAPRLASDLRDDFSAYFAECMVRAVELKLTRLSPGEREAAMDRDDTDGYVLVRPLFLALENYEKSEPSMALYFPELVRSIDEATEAKRVAAIQFSPAESAAAASDPASQEIRRSRAALPSTIPNDAAAIAALTEGERRIAEKNPRAAEAAFQKVLVKYPEQVRAWYGLGLVALLDHDGVRAKEVFGRLTTGEHAAVHDPLVMAWSHIYLGRIYDDEGHVDLAKSEFQAAIAVQDGPEQAKEAAQKGLEAANLEKPRERP